MRGAAEYCCPLLFIFLSPVSYWFAWLLLFALNIVDSLLAALVMATLRAPSGAIFAAPLHPEI